MGEIDYGKRKVIYGDGVWAIAHTVEIAADALKFEDLHPISSYVRQQDIARMHFARARARGEGAPHILTWTAMQTDRRADQLLPGLDYQSDDGETIISANSFITFMLRKMLSAGWLQLHEYLGDTYEWQVDIPAAEDAWRERAEAILRWLEASIQLDLYPNVERGSYEPRVFQPFDTRRNFVRIGRCDFVRHFVQNHERQAVFNTSHFLHEHDDLISHHSGYGDAVGLMAAEGMVLRPPIYRRGALLHDGGGWRINSIGLEDIGLLLPGEARLGAGDGSLAVNPAEPQPVALYTRAGGLGRSGRPMERTPMSSGRLEFVLVNRQVVAWKRGGNVQIPQNGFILSLQDGALAEETCASIIENAWVEYELAPQYASVRAGIQAGPILLRGGESVIGQAADTEDFWQSRDDIIGISPVRMDLSAAARKARSGIGIKADGNLVLLTVDGCENGSRSDLDSAGATLTELAGMLREAGAVDALNLSGEGSSHLFVKGGLANAPSDRRGQPGVVYERMLPSIGIVG